MIDMKLFKKELENLINIHSVDNEFNTPDYILADYLVDCLVAYNMANVDPTSKYYIDRVWEEYHKLKDELADTKCKLAQAEDIIDAQRTLIKQIHKDEDALIQAIKPITILVDAAKELETNYADAYAVNKVRRAYKDIEETWEDVRARCS